MSRTHPLEIPDELEEVWERYKDTIPRSQFVGDPLLVCMVRHLREQRGDQYVNDILNDEVKPHEGELRERKGDYFVDQILKDIDE